MNERRTKRAETPAERRDAAAREGWEIVSVAMRPDKARYWSDAPTRLGMHRGRSRLIADVLERFGEPYVEGQVTEEAA